MRRLACLALFFSVGCALMNARGPQPAPPTPEISIQRSTLALKKAVMGRKFYLDEANATRGILSEAIFQRVKEIVRQRIQAKGFREVTDRAKAHLTVFLYSDRISSPKEQARFSVTADINEYGKRPVRMKWITFTSPKGEWIGYEDRLLTQLEKELTDWLDQAPQWDTRMKGDPGCSPRFGYKEENSLVTEVLNGSPAQEAGIQVGDILLALDSEPITAEISTEIYEKRVRIPVKIKRSDKIFRTQIQAAIMCN